MLDCVCLLGERRQMQPFQGLQQGLAVDRLADGYNHLTEQLEAGGVWNC